MNIKLASFIIFYQEFLGYGEKKQPDDELNAVKKLMYKWKIISEEDDDGEALELYEKIREGIKTYEDGFLKIGHTISNLNLDDNQILTFVKACIEMYLFTNSSDGKFTGDELVSDDEIKYRFYEGYDEETKKAFKNLKFLEIINDSIGDDKVVKILLDMIMNQLNQQNISEEYKQYQLTINKIGFITGEESKQVSLSELAKAIVSGEDNYEGYIESSETGWRESVREHGEYGPTTLIDIIINPDGSELDVDLNKFYPEDSEPVDGDENIGSIGTFSEFRFVIDKGTMSNYTMDLEKEFDSKYLRPVFNEHSLCGIISHYEYDNKEASDSELFIESEIEESRPSMGGGIYLFYNDEQGLKQLWDFDELKKEMNAENINVSELSEVVQFLESKYKKLDESEAIQNDELTFLIGKVNEYVSNFDPTPILENESFPLRWEADVLIQDYDFKENTLNLDEGDNEYLTSIGTAIEIKKYDNGSYEFWDGVHYKESHSWISELNNNKDYPSFSLLNKKFEDFESLKSFLDETYG